MLPCVRPRSVAQHIADGVAGDRLPVVARQKVRPVFGCVAVCDRVERRDPFKAARRVGVFALFGNVPTRVVGVGPRLSRRRIVFPRQLVQSVIDIRRGVCSVVDAQIVPVRVVGVGIRLVVRRADGIGQRPYLRGSMRIVRVRVPVGRHDHGDRLIAALGRMIQIVRPQASVGVVAVFARDAAVAYNRWAVVRVVGIGSVVECAAVEGLLDAAQIVVCIVCPADEVLQGVIRRIGLDGLPRPARKIVQEARLGVQARIRDAAEIALVVIGVDKARRRVRLELFGDQSIPIVVGVGDVIPVAVDGLRKREGLIVGVVSVQNEVAAADLDPRNLRESGVEEGIGRGGVRRIAVRDRPDAIVFVGVAVFDLRRAARKPRDGLLLNFSCNYSFSARSIILQSFPQRSL